MILCLSSTFLEQKYDYEKGKFIHHYAAGAASCRLCKFNELFLKQKKQKLWSEEHFHPQFWENELNLHFYER